VLDRIGQVRVAWSERMWPDAGPEVPDPVTDASFDTDSYHQFATGRGRPVAQVAAEAFHAGGSTGAG
jgi:hypothetical protein